MAAQITKATKRLPLSLGAQLEGFAFLIDRHWAPDHHELARCLRQAKDQAIPLPVLNYVAEALEALPEKNHPWKKEDKNDPEKKSTRGRHFAQWSLSDAEKRQAFLFFFSQLSKRQFTREQRLERALQTVEKYLGQKLGIGLATRKAWIATDNANRKARQQKLVDEFEKNFGNRKSG